MQVGSRWLRKACTCFGVQQTLVQRSTIPLLATKVTQRTNNLHRPKCPLYFPSNDKKELSFGITIPGVILTRAVFLTWSCNYGAGGFSISGNLQLKGFKRKDSPAFALVDRYVSLYEATDQSRFDFDNLFSGLSTLFEAGKAFPGELDERGSTLLHVIYCQLSHERTKRSLTSN